MLRHRHNRDHRPESTTLTAAERRRFRQVRRGLRATDPDWFAVYCPRGSRNAFLVRCSAVALSFVLVVAGALTGFLPMVLCGVLLAVGVITSHVSARARGWVPKP